MKRALLLALAMVAGSTVACREAASPPPSVETLPPQPLPDETPKPVFELMPLQTQLAEPRLAVWVRPMIEAVPAGNYSVQALETLVLTAELVNGTPGAEVILELDAPGGLSYQRMTAKVEGEPAKAVFRLPVAGTWIHQNQMTGIWSARFLAEGAVAGTQTFELSE